MPTFHRFSDRRLRKAVKDLSNRKTHNPEWDSAHCTQCRVLFRAKDEAEERRKAKVKMKTIRKISNRKIDALDLRLTNRLHYCTTPSIRFSLLKKLSKITAERIRRLGL